MKKILLVLLLCACIPFEVSAQGGLRFPELSKKLEPYFEQEMIDDIKKQLPQGSDYSIWGWDVGDYSGDGFSDVAISIKIAGEKKRTSHVYFFVDIDGYLSKITELPYDYVELPLEIGVVIKENTCFITKKRRQFDWLIRGYQFSKGTLILNDEFTTNRVEDLTHERRTDYLSLKNSERFIKTLKGEEQFSKNYLLVPSYTRGRQIFQGFASEAYSNYIDYVSKGAFYWQGDSDCGFYLSSAYDNEYLYLTVRVIDEQVITQYCDTCVCDYVELWFDINTPPSEENLFEMIKNKDNPVKKTQKGIFCFKVYPGDFKEKKAYVKELVSTDKLYKFQKEATGWIKAASSLQSDGYTIKIRIPFPVFRYEGPPLEEKNFARIGFTAVVHDIDNEYRPEEETLISSSAFDSQEPLTYGSLLIVPIDKWYGETFNIYKDDIMKYLQDLGF
ncbi:MAG: sugar-binding protein [Bacteroidota bacterium]